MNARGSGYFGEFGGRYVPDTLYQALVELESAFSKIVPTAAFQRQFKYYLSHYVGRETPLFLAENLSKVCGFSVYLKREDLNHTGAHKINNCIGQALLAKAMKKKRIIAETGAGQHGVATATVCALMGLECVVYMGAEDMRRQALNVKRMNLLGARVVPVNSGSKTLKDATTEAIRDWMANVESTFYIIGSVVGPDPYPTMVRTFQSVIGTESRAQILKQTGKLPDYVVACVGGGSNSMGMFSAFIADKKVGLIAVEAAGHGLSTDEHAASLQKGRVGVLHGAKSLILQEKTGQIKLAHSISAGLDYPGVGPELAHLKTTKRMTVTAATDKEAIAACKWLAQSEGIIPALESSHAIAVLKKKALFKNAKSVLVCLSGRGDKDMETISAYL